MTSRIPFALVGLALLIALAAVPSAPAPPAAVRAAATLGVTFNYSPSTVSVNSPTQIQISISSGVSPYTIWVNGSAPGCAPPSSPFQTNNASNFFGCNPTATGTFNTHVDVSDNAGNHGSASATLNVQSGGGNTGGNGTGGFNLGGLQDMLQIVLVMAFVFLACVVAIAASAVALAILVPRRLKQIRKALQGEPMKKAKSKPESSKAEAPKVDAPKEEPPKD